MWLLGRGAPRGAFWPCDGARPSRPGCRSSRGQAEGSPNWGTPARVASSP